MTNRATFEHWVQLSPADTWSLLLALIGYDFGPEPEKRIPEIKDSRKAFANYVADRSGISSEDIVLDLGSGCGFGTYWFGQRAKLVHACDISPAYLSFAARECATLKNVSFHLVEPRRLDCLDANSIDVACAMSVFIHFNLYDIYWYFKEFARIVRPGGRIWIDVADSESLDFNTPTPLVGYFLQHARAYHEDATSIPGLMQWNSVASVVQVAKWFGFHKLEHLTGGQLLFAKHTTVPNS